MKNLTWLTVLLALCSWMFVSSRSALAHPGSECAVFDCGEDHDGDKDDDGSGSHGTLDCGEDHGDEDHEESDEG